LTNANSKELKLASSINASLSAGVVTTADTSGVLNLQTAGTTAITVNASQLVGVGTASPAAALSVINSTMTNQIAIGLNTTDTTYGSISLNGNNSSTRLGITGGGGSDNALYIDVPSGGLHYFRNAGTVKMTLNGNGVLALSGASTSANGVGITFPATQSASSNANTLDDYEEGTWTPTAGSGLTVTGTFVASGTYTKIGRLVTVNFAIQGTLLTCTNGTQLIAGLPFSHATDAIGSNGVLVNSVPNTCMVLMFMGLR